MSENRYIFYNTGIVTHPRNDHLAGIAKFRKFFSIYPQSSVFIDRTLTVKTPVKTHSLYPVPALRPFKKTYAEICHERAQQLLLRAETRNVPIYVSWSGGIDSTALLIALMQNATPSQLARITIMLTRDSIAEYPAFYEDHIRGTFRCESTSLFPYLLGTDTLVIGGENNDQVFGSDVIGRLIAAEGPASIHKPYERAVFERFFGGILKDDAVTAFCVDLIERIGKNASVQLQSNFDYLWWLNFAVKWQFVATRMLPYVSRRNAGNLGGGYTGELFEHFYNTEDFQLWSMSNMDKKIRDTWSTYKWPAKDFIYAFTKDDEYRKHKLKRGSLATVLQQHQSYNFLDQDFRCYESLEPSQWHEPENDFT